ncbi:haloacid dehalogenase [Kitasatospora phosalacinea]|uniref:Haloacid dehalogenase n=1 Tax=Kitasatospora phosalacinea TaxID=2065 RepID=A0A9W6QG07_9ACTN|nr:HAD family hydrolase [Kitasatospora phosalacinea]GLW74286.1 haloacid dehalogenase [Kitasatospora phosalacinea]
MIEAVLFDLDGTLLDHDAAAEAAVLAGVAAELAEPSGHRPDGEPAPGAPEFDQDEVLRFWRRVERTEYDRYLAGELTVQEQRRARAVALAAHLGLGPWSAERADAWFAGYLRCYRASWRAYPDVPDAVRELGAGRRLGVITNGEGAIQRSKLHAIGLGALAPHTTASGECGRPKPDPAIFHLACRTLGTDPARTAYVGDRLDLDARAATAAGLLGIWLDRTPAPGAEPPADVPRVRSLAEVAALLA